MTMYRSKSKPSFQHLETLPEYPPRLEVVPELRAAFEVADQNSQPIDELEVATQLHQALMRLDRKLTLAERRGAARSR